MLQVQQFLQDAKLEAEAVLRRESMASAEVPTKRSPEATIRQVAEEHFPRLEEALQALDDAYEGHAKSGAQAGHSAWFGARDDDVSLEEQDAPIEGDSIPRSVATTYGELRPESVAVMLADAEARPGQRYYDLGSGTGKTVVLAWLLGLNATGIELVSNRYDTACGALDRAAQAGPGRMGLGHNDSLRFVQGNFLQVDFSDADVIFTDSVMFSPETKESLARAARRLKPGARVVSYGGLPGPGLRRVMRFKGPTSWANFTEWTIQEVEPGAQASASLEEAQHAHSGNPPETCSL